MALFGRIMRRWSLAEGNVLCVGWREQDLGANSLISFPFLVSQLLLPYLPAMMEPYSKMNCLPSVALGHGILL